MDILVEIVEALERDAVPAEIRIASVLDRIKCLRSPNTGSRSLSLLAVEAYERGYQEAQSKFATAEEHIYNKGFKEGRTERKVQGKTVFEAGVEQGKRHALRAQQERINKLADERDAAYKNGYIDGKASACELQQRELNERYSIGYRLGHVEGYNKGLDEFKNKWCTHDNAYQEGYRKGSDEKALQSATDIIRLRKEYDAEINHLQLALKQAGKNYLDLRQEYTDTLEKAKEEHAAEVLKLTYKNELALEVKWREGYREGKAIADKAVAEAHVSGIREGRMQKVHAVVDEARSQGYQNGLKDGYYNGLQEAAKAVDTKILAVTYKEPTLGGIPEGSQAVADTSNWDMRERARQ